MEPIKKIELKPRGWRTARSSAAQIEQLEQHVTDGIIAALANPNVDVVIEDWREDGTVQADRKLLRTRTGKLLRLTNRWITVNRPQYAKSGVEVMHVGQYGTEVYVTYYPEGRPKEVRTRRT